MFRIKQFYSSSMIIASAAVLLLFCSCGEDCATCPGCEDGTITPAGWFVQAQPTEEHLRAVQALNANTIIAVGDSGTILKSADGGNTWDLIESGTTESLRQVSFLDEATGWIAGTNGVLLNSTDGGATWTLKTPGFSTHFRDIQFIDENVGWAGGSAWGPVLLEGVVAISVDGGETWESQLSVSANSLFFVDAESGCVAGGDGQIHRTTDGGATWTTIDVGAPGWLGCVCFVNANIGWVAGWGGVVFKTIDGGATWTPQADGTERTIPDIFFIDSNFGWFVANSPGTICATVDGGEN
ncbi:MAG: hypothetical protein JSW58_09805 [Candidatus Latescibacterota bacterium]|nr:MAG: hypothetical protein JSW58_09805 [Candidatus Latescibacterota bacterium]